MSTECTMKVQEIQRKCDAETLQNVVVFLRLISDAFEEEQQDDDDDNDYDFELVRIYLLYFFLNTTRNSLLFTF